VVVELVVVVLVQAAVEGVEAGVVQAVDQYLWT
jgi:hypothetical protein